MTRRIAGRQCESKKTSCAFTIEYLVTQLVKNPLVNAGDARDSGSIPGLQRSQRRKRQPTPVLLPGKFHGQRSLAGYSAWGRRMRHNWAYMHTCIQFRVQMVVELGNESRTVHEMKWNEIQLFPQQVDETMVLFTDDWVRSNISVDMFVEIKISTWSH